MTAPRPCIELTKLELSCTVVRPKSTDGVCEGLCACTSEGMQARAKRRVALLRERFIVVYLGENKNRSCGWSPNDRRANGTPGPFSIRTRYQRRTDAHTRYMQRL